MCSESGVTYVSGMDQRRVERATRFELATFSLATAMQQNRADEPQFTKGSLSCNRNCCTQFAFAILG